MDNEDILYLCSIGIFMIALALIVSLDVWSPYSDKVTYIEFMTNCWYSLYENTSYFFSRLI
jgi:hypothetical protein